MNHIIRVAAFSLDTFAKQYYTAIGYDNVEYIFSIGIHANIKRKFIGEKRSHITQCTNQPQTES